MIWILARSRDWINEIKNFEDKIFVTETMDGANGEKLFPFPFNLYESPDPQYQKLWESRATFLFCSCTETTIAARVVDRALCSHKWRQNKRQFKGIPTLKRQIGFGKYLKYLDERGRKYNSGSVDSSVRDRLVARKEFILDESLGIYNYVHGIPFDHLVNNHQLLDLTDFSNDAYQLLAAGLLTKLHFAKIINPDYCKIHHLIFIDDCLILVKKKAKETN